MVKKIKNILKYLQEDIWRVSIGQLPKWKALAIRQLRVILLAFRGFSEDKLDLRASALTFYSILSVVPIVAMAFGVAKGFGLQSTFEEAIKKRFYGQEEVLDWVIKFANSFLENTKGGLIAGIGLVILFFAVMKMLSNIESSFNDIWQIRTPRTWYRKFADYFSLMFIGPVLLIMSSSATVFITTQVTQIVEEVSLLGHVSPIIFFLIKLIPYVLIWLLLTLVYMIMPNTKVSFKSALLAGIIAGTLFVLLQWGYVKFQVGVSRYNAIYGSFAALPLFVMWLQISWLVVLFGSEISFANQNVEKYEYESDALNLSPFNKRILVLLVMHRIVKNFQVGKHPYTAKELSLHLEIPIRLVRETLYLLKESRLVVETLTKEEKLTAFQPAIDIQQITIGTVIKSLDHIGVNKLMAAESPVQQKITDTLEAFEKRSEEDEQNVLLKNID
jgi:membrane protein